MVDRCCFQGIYEGTSFKELECTLLLYIEAKMYRESKQIVLFLV